MRRRSKSKTSRRAPRGVGHDGGGRERVVHQVERERKGEDFSGKRERSSVPS